jgi:hypothetical protein
LSSDWVLELKVAEGSRDTQHPRNPATLHSSPGSLRGEHPTCFVRSRVVRPRVVRPRVVQPRVVRPRVVRPCIVRPSCVVRPRVVRPKPNGTCPFNTCKVKPHNLAQPPQQSEPHARYARNSHLTRFPSISTEVSLPTMNIGVPNYYEKSVPANHEQKRPQHAFDSHEQVCL